LKLTGWYQDGERELRIGAQQKTETFDRKRYGLGTVFRRGPWHVAGEWVKADGMIFNGTDGGAVPGSVGNQGNVIAGFNVLPDDDADGWYLDGGYRLFDKWELRARYDRLNRGTNEKEVERRFETFARCVNFQFIKPPVFSINRLLVICSNEPEFICLLTDSGYFPRCSPYSPYLRRNLPA